MGFSGAFRRSELVAINAEDVLGTGDGLVLNLRRTKVDQEAAGRPVAIPRGRETATCAVQALTALALATLLCVAGVAMAAYLVIVR